MTAMRLTSRMKPGVHTFAIASLAVMLTLAVFACPLWMLLQDDCNMPCPKDASSNCPLTVCELSSPYLAAAGIHASVLKIAPAEHVNVPLLLSWTVTRDSILSNDSGPPGHLGSIFLNIHSLRI